MARLIPAFTDDRTPPGEREVFNLLAGGPEDWVVFHSLDLAPWNRGLRTEVDFVVVVPDRGILCIEVKSHENLTFDGERWEPPQITRSPFKQAEDARHTFYRRFTELAPHFRRVPVVHCCIFPRTFFDLHPNLSVQPWELMDARVFGSFRGSGNFCQDLKERISKSIAADRSLCILAVPLSKSEAEQIVAACVPVQKRRPNARQEIQAREEEVERILRDQQKPILRLAALNSRIVVSGAAGTGKTLIAMEVARRAAERGSRTALVSFNQLVGDWMRQRLLQRYGCPPNLIAGRAIRLMAEMTGVLIPEDPSGEFWELELPQKLEERLTDPELRATALFDYLVVDEAQDLLSRPRLWECLCQFLAGGLHNGAFVLFGDFDHQVLSQRVAMLRSMAALDASGHPVHWSLFENCRNYRVVGDTAVQLGGLGATVYSGYLRVGGGVHNYDIFFYDDEDEQVNRLRQWLKDFIAQGYKATEITILSFRSESLSAAARLQKSGFALRPAWQAGNHTAYTTVHAFKGMETKIVFLTDVVLEDHDFQRDLFYTGMTRATESVRVLCDRRSQETLLNWLSGRNFK